MDPSWYQKVSYAGPYIERADYRIVRRYRSKLIRKRTFAQALAEYFKTQRLLPEEIQEWSKLCEMGQELGDPFREKIKLAFAEGVLKDDLATIDDEALAGTCGQLLFQWVRAQYLGTEIVDALPRLLTDSSKEKGIDCFEILGDPSDSLSLYFIAWEVKATDSDVTSRTDEIYQMHKKRSPRLLRGLQMQLSLKYPQDKYPDLGMFVRRILDHWLANTPSKKIGGAVVFDTSKMPGNVFTTFHSQFPDLYAPSCRQVLLIEVPQFRKTRSKLWKHLLTQMS
jgi:hypothetical protein